MSGMAMNWCGACGLPAHGDSKTCHAMLMAEVRRLKGDADAETKRLRAETEMQREAIKRHKAEVERLREALLKAREWAMGVTENVAAKDFPGHLDMNPEEWIDAVLQSTAGSN